MLEVIIPGTPVSAQTSSAKRRVAWKELVADRARAHIREDDRFEFEDVKVTLVWFAFDWEEGDLDNIAKPILVGLCGPAFSDDQWVTELTLRRTDLDDSSFALIAPSPTLAAALDEALVRKQDFVYARITAGVDHRRLP